MTEVVFAVYVPHSGKGKELEKLVLGHSPALRELELITDRKEIVVRSSNGSMIEVFEWRSAKAAEMAHEHPKVAKIWEAMAKVCDFGTLKSLPESEKRFPHFTPV